MKKIIGVAGVAVGLTWMSVSSADGARPIHFWASVLDLIGNPAHPIQNYQWTPGSAVPTRLTGWMCKMTPTRTVSDPGLPEKGWPASVYQAADLECESASGTIEATAMCTLQSESAYEAGRIKIKDKSGTDVEVSVLCSNHTAAEDEAARKQAGLR